MKTITEVMSTLAGTTTLATPHKNITIGGSMLDDKVTTERVEAALGAESNPELKGVHVSTTNGAVTLTGTVHDEKARERAAQAAKTVHRVTKLNNQIQVRP